MKKYFYPLLVLTIAVSLALIGCAKPAPAPTTPAPVAKTVTVKVGIMADMTGPYAPMWPSFEQAFNGVKKWTEVSGFFPKELKVEFLTLDHANDVSKIVTVYKRMRDEGVSVIISNSSIDSSAVKLSLEEDKIPCITQGSGRALFEPPGWVFTLPPLYEDQTAAFIDWMLTDWKGPGKPKLAILTWDSPAGRAAISDYVRQYAKMKGVEIVTEEYISKTPVDTSTEVRRIVDKGANYTFGVLHASPWSVVLKDAQRLGVIDKVHFASNYALDLYELMGYVPKEAEGMLCPCWYIAFIEGVPKHIYQTIGAELPTTKTIFGEGLIWTEMSVAFEAMRLSIKDRGVQPIDGSTMFQYLLKVKDFDCFGYAKGINPSNQHAAASKMRMQRIHDGKIEFYGDWFTVPDVKAAVSK